MPRGAAPPSQASRFSTCQTRGTVWTPRLGPVLGFSTTWKVASSPHTVQERGPVSRLVTCQGTFPGGRLMVTQGCDTFSTNEQPGSGPPEATVFKTSAG